MDVGKNNTVLLGHFAGNIAQLQANPRGTLRVHSRILRQQIQTVDASNIITGQRGSGEWVQVGRNALPLFNAGLVGTQRQTLYLRSSPMNDVSNFGADILYPVLVRDAEALGIYRALGVPAASVTTLKGPRTDIISTINLNRPIPVADGFTGDVVFHLMVETPASGSPPPLPVEVHGSVDFFVRCGYLCCLDCCCY